MIQSIRGFKDILPGETEIWQYVSKTAVELFHDFGYREIYTPIIEKASLFTRSIGDETDIVEKEMYTFPDRKGSILTLRPEATSSIVRAFIQNKMYGNNYKNKLYNIGPMFRRERPQKGRYRQFYQIDVETFGIKEAYIDAEMIFMLQSFFNKLSLKDTTVCLNSLGCPKCRPKFKTYLFEKISSILPYLCEDCIKRKDKNPFRILDCKNDLCKKSIKDIKSIIDFLCRDCKVHFEKLIHLLEELKVPFKLDRNLVRGLDYYTRTAFEIHHNKLGAQSAIAGGGRYDELVKILGGPETPAIGFAVGFNRLVDLISFDYKSILKPALFIIPLGEKALTLSFKLQMKFVSEGIRTILGSYEQSLKAQLKQANRSNVRYALILGERELERNEVLLRDMNKGLQSFILLNDVVCKIRQKFFKHKENCLD